MPVAGVRVLEGVRRIAIVLEEIDYQLEGYHAQEGVSGKKGKATLLLARLLLRSAVTSAALL